MQDFGWNLQTNIVQFTRDHSCESRNPEPVSEPIDPFPWIPVCTGMTPGFYFRFQTGWRFSAKAVTPSRMSECHVWSIMYRSARCRAVAYSGGMLRPMSMGLLAATYFRFQTGWRFSAKAASMDRGAPSLMSSATRTASAMRASRSGTMAWMRPMS